MSLIPGAAPWGLYKSTDGGATWTFLHNGSANATECDTVAEGNAGGSPARCAACGALRSIRSIPRSCTPGRMPAVSGAPSTGCDLVADQALPQRAPEHHASRDRRQRASQRQDAHVRLRRPHQRRRPVQPSLPQRRRGERSARLRRPHLERRRQPGLRDLQRVHRTVLVRQLRVHAGRSSRRRLRGRLVLLWRGLFRTSAVSCSRPTPA